MKVAGAITAAPVTSISSPITIDWLEQALHELGAQHRSDPGWKAEGLARIGRGRDDDDSPGDV